MELNWSSHIHTMSQMYSSLQFLNSKSIYKGNVHPILKHKYYSALIIDRIPIKLRIVTGTYVLQTKRIKFYRDESGPTCLLCGNAEETIQHFISIQDLLLDFITSIIINTFYYSLNKKVIKCLVFVRNCARSVDWHRQMK
jgi:hypothetical protein